MVGALATSCAATSGEAIVLGNDRDAFAPSFTPTSGDAAPVPEPDAGLCNAYECPAPFATCPGTSGLCTTNLNKDFHHCGSCDTECPTPPLGHKSMFLCATGRCQMVCEQGFADCNQLIDDGCEVSLDIDPANCGACGTKCAPGEICWKGACGCPNGYSECDGKCVYLPNDSENCGACGNSCGRDTTGQWPCGEGVEPLGTVRNCASSECGQHCIPGFADCNNDLCGDGCEISLQNDPKNCGACGHACSAEQICINGKCECDPGRTLCDRTCTDLQSDPKNCGACGYVCPGAEKDTPTGAAVCVLGRCSYQCAAGYADCDNRIANGCEVDLTNDPSNCGSCGAHCDLAGGQPCIAGQCLRGPCDAGGVH